MKSSPTFKRAVTALVALMLAAGLYGCAENGTEPAADGTTDQGTTQINPQTPVDKADVTVDDANAVTDDQTNEINELTDDE